jgi:hypothetical protein
MRGQRLYVVPRRRTRGELADLFFQVVVTVCVCALALRLIVSFIWHI